ncbi:hypothetical protein POTOM_042754 [Populus tomentosa]|uniref:Peptidase A1 domain-containing protein n=1 Tax=Populus tomentosa TaxID=118781 RepID=A0A8X7YQI7_POPTO|nr:hypothetical protein POTOM_042754 [Populus tomentosa]
MFDGLFQIEGEDLRLSRGCCWLKFYYAYGDGSLIARLYRDSIRLPLSNQTNLIFNNFTFGCAHTTLAEPIRVAGFGRGVLSLPAQLATLSPQLGNQFSYCLMSHSFDSDGVLRTSPLILGRYDHDEKERRVNGVNKPSFVYTSMLDNPKHPYFYCVGLEGISIGRKNIPAPDFLRKVDREGSGGVVVDSGTTFTMLPASLRRSNIELEYGIVDALEVARQVAQEVEREVVDFREQSCSSSSEKIMESGIKQPGSPDSINAKQDLSTEIPPENVPTRQNQPFETHAEQEERMIDSNNLENEGENGMHDLESSQVTEVAQEPEVNAEKGLCDFDLNEEVCSEDMDRPVNTISAPIPGFSLQKSAFLIRKEKDHWEWNETTICFKKLSLEMDLSVVCMLILVLVCHGVGLNDMFQESKCKKDGPAIRFPFGLDKQAAYCGYDPGFVLSCNERKETLWL